MHTTQLHSGLTLRPKCCVTVQLQILCQCVILSLIRKIMFGPSALKPLDSNPLVGSTGCIIYWLVASKAGSLALILSIVHGRMGKKVRHLCSGIVPVQRKQRSW